MKKTIYIGLVVLVVLSTLVAAVQDRFLFKATGDNLQIGEQIGEVTPVIDHNQIGMLSRGTIFTDQGYARFSQTIEFTGNDIQSPRLIFGQDRDDRVNNYLFINGGDYFMNYVLSFDPALKGLWEQTSEDSGIFDFQGKQLNILGKQYDIVKTDGSLGEHVLDFMISDAPVTSTLEQGETKTYTVEGQDYEITSVYITAQCAKFSVNGELTNCLEMYETDYLNNGIPLLVTGVHNNTNQSNGSNITRWADFKFGGNVIEIEDQYSDDDYNMGLSINSEIMDDARVRIHADMDNYLMKVYSIEYKLKADNLGGGTDIYIGPRERLSEKSEEPLLGDWDLGFASMSFTPTTSIKYEMSGDEQLNLLFKNKQGAQYDIPLLNTEAEFKMGTSENTLWIREAYNADDFRIAQGDLFFTTDVNTSNQSRITNVLSYDSIDTQNQRAYFTELAGGTRTVSYQGTPGVDAHGDLVLNGNVFGFYIGPAASGYAIAIDMNGNGMISIGDVVPVHTRGQGELILPAPYGNNLTHNMTSVGYRTTHTVIEEQNKDERYYLHVRDLGDSLILDPDVSMPLYDGENVPEGELWGMTGYGNFIKAFENQDVSIQHPLNQRFGYAYIQGETQSSGHVQKHYKYMAR